MDAWITCSTCGSKAIVQSLHKDSFMQICVYCGFGICQFCMETCTRCSSKIPISHKKGHKKCIEQYHVPAHCDGLRASFI